MAPIAPLPRWTGWDMAYLLRAGLYQDYPLGLKFTRRLGCIYVHRLATDRLPCALPGASFMRSGVLMDAFGDPFRLSASGCISTKLTTRLGVSRRR
jgi:hypothetical protein